MRGRNNGQLAQDGMFCAAVHTVGYEEAEHWPKVTYKKQAGEHLYR